MIIGNSLNCNNNYEDHIEIIGWLDYDFGFFSLKSFVIYFHWLTCVKVSSYRAIFKYLLMNSNSIFTLRKEGKRKYYNLYQRVGIFNKTGTLAMPNNKST